HRHWIVLVRNVILPILVCFVVLSAWTYFLSYGDVARLLRLGWGWNLALFAISAVPGAWLIWRYEDWRNDYYVVASDRIIDVNRRPFGFGGEVKEAPMANVQNVSMRIPNFLSSALDSGDINVETAGQQSGLVFLSIHHPRDVLARVASMVDAFREAQLAQEQAARQQELTTWFSTYADLNRIAIVESPASSRVGDKAQVSWRVSGQATDVDTWLDWKLGGAIYRVAQQSGGPGNYRGDFTVPLVRDISFSAGARIADVLYQSSEERLVVSDFELIYPPTASSGLSLDIRWRHGAEASHAEVLWDTRSHGREDEYPHMETASLNDDWWTYSFIPPAGEAVYFRLRARMGTALLYSPEHTVSAFASP
ncbi:MAG: hypothetical protein Q7R39_08280, partial [Dehalococcoidia bacterium]|nr:hypothetical protein [Dehalococcoidia bacterium]